MICTKILEYYNVYNCVLVFQWKYFSVLRDFPKARARSVEQTQINFKNLE